MKSPFFTVKSPSQDVQALAARVPSALRAVEPGGDLPRWLYRALQWGGPWDVMAAGFMDYSNIIMVNNG